MAISSIDSFQVDKYADVICSCKKHFIFEKVRRTVFVSLEKALFSTLLAFANKATMRN